MIIRQCDVCGEGNAKPIAIPFDVNSNGVRVDSGDDDYMSKTIDLCADHLAFSLNSMITWCMRDFATNSALVMCNNLLIELKKKSFRKEAF